MATELPPLCTGTPPLPNRLLATDGRQRSPFLRHKQFRSDPEASLKPGVKPPPQRPRELDDWGGGMLPARLFLSGTFLSSESLKNIMIMNTIHGRDYKLCPTYSNRTPIQFWFLDPSKGSFRCFILNLLCHEAQVGCGYVTGKAVSPLCEG